MSSKLTAFSPPPPLRSSVLKNPPEAIPPTEELESLHNELKLLKQRTLERARKAGEDLKTIEESIRRIRDREKGKTKVVDKIKRERDYTPSLDGDETRYSASIGAKPRTSSLPLTSGHPSSTRSSLDPRRSAVDELKKKKKKRKRDFEDSDGELEPQKGRKGTPPVNNIHPHVPSLKAQKPAASTSQQHSKPVTGPDFSLPPSDRLFLQRPSVPLPPIPGPSKPTDVMDDFSKQKLPPQTLVTTFFASIEPWIRPIKEEDVGFLEYTGDEVEPYIMPKLGRHYMELWEEEDIGLQREASPPMFVAPVPKWDPSTLNESELTTEEKGHGPLTERVISALLPMPENTTVWKGVKAAEDAMEGRPGGSGAAAARKERLNVSDLEDRIRDTMRYHGLIDGMPDYTEKVDDPIATALRHAQRKLRTVVATNKLRKGRLTAIARDRLGYQEYLDLRDTLDKNISALYAKLQKKDGPKLGRKKKKLSETPAPNGNAPANSSVIGTISALPPCPAAVGLGPDDENRLGVPEQLKQLVETRRQWVDQVGSVFEQKERENPGRIWGLPKESVFKGVDEEVRLMLMGQQMSEQRTSIDNGKGKIRADQMDVG